MQNIVQCFHRIRCRFYVLVYALINFYIYIYEKIGMIKYWKLDYFHNININVVFLLNNFLFYI